MLRLVTSRTRRRCPDLARATDPIPLRSHEFDEFVRSLRESVRDMSFAPGAGLVTQK